MIDDSGSLTFSSPELPALRAALARGDVASALDAIPNARERRECRAKLEGLGVLVWWPPRAGLLEGERSPAKEGS